MRQKRIAVDEVSLGDCAEVAARLEVCEFGDVPFIFFDRARAALFLPRDVS